MKFRIHFEINGIQDSIDIEEDSLEQIKTLANDEIEKRGLCEYKNNVWSEEI